MRRLPFPRCTSAALASLILLTACSDNNSSTSASTATPVAVATARLSQAGATSLPGRIEAWRSAEVRARVAGIVLQRHFEEGADVKAGQKLFTIDPAPFEAELAEREAAQAKAKALLTEAEAALTRAEQLVGSGAISQQALDRARAEADSARAEWLAAAAAVKTAKLQLSYAHVTAPISGRIGRALVTEGALVGHNESTPLALIQQIDRVYANFSQPVAESLHWQQAGEVALSLRVDGSGEPFRGKLLFADISVDPQTAQVSLRGEFANPERKLLPGMYVQVTPELNQQGALAVPSRAVHHDPDKRAFIWVVNSERQAEQRFVSLGAVVGQQWQILDGLNEGEMVITGGKVEAGSAVALPQDAAK